MIIFMVVQWLFDGFLMILPRFLVGFWDLIQVFEMSDFGSGRVFFPPRPSTDELGACGAVRLSPPTLFVAGTQRFRSAYKQLAARWWSLS